MKANSAKEASFKAAHILTKHKKTYTDGGMVNEGMTEVAYKLFKEHKSKTEIMSAIADIQLGSNTVARDFHHHTEVRWLSGGKILLRFCSLLNEIKAFMESREDTTLLSDTEWLIDLALPTDITEKLNQLNNQLQD
ncbi:unnamed protein product [Lepeophtheirus salmonis]|uniref:(salmon louse) hypothetical protein n=1 Tax=Lepeophtheirus salmonis TaxID=72036 RepID=A0A7R8D698_LEPSM|nr:unnamed protein product [Lepeophtheirus salmonis]CAF3043086.1 unnamed protein product [Lepeophtheirus salmonis]